MDRLSIYYTKPYVAAKKKKAEVHKLAWKDLQSSIELVVK